jgi:hypothetical protein
MHTVVQNTPKKWIYWKKKILQDPSIQGVNKQVYEGLIRFQHWKFHSKQFQKLVNQDGEKILSHTK